MEPYDQALWREWDGHIESAKFSVIAASLLSDDMKNSITKADVRELTKKFRRHIRESNRHVRKAERVRRKIERRYRGRR